MNTYTIPAGTQIWRRGHVTGSYLWMADWHLLTTTRAVTYTDDDRVLQMDRAQHYYFRLPASATPYTRVKVRRTDVLKQAVDTSAQSTKYVGRRKP